MAYGRAATNASNYSARCAATSAGNSTRSALRAWGPEPEELAAANQRLTAELAAAKQELADTQDSLAAARPASSRSYRRAAPAPPGTGRRSTPPPARRRSSSGIKPAEIAKSIFGLTLPVSTANDFVLAPVSQLAASSNPVVAAAISQYKAAGGDLAPGAPADQVPSAQQATWLNNYAKALSTASAKFTPTSVTVPAGNYGPVPVIITAEMTIASNGSLDGYFQGSQQQLSTNTTMGTMFFSDGSLWGNIAEAQGVGGDQWGVMNELWNFPGQVWLWLYSGMYQIPALASNNANLDLDVGLLMIVFGFLLPMFAPWIPVINRIPRWIPLYKIIYRQYYRGADGGQPPAAKPTEPATPSTPQQGA